MQPIVFKFGGTSLADANATSQATEIIRKQRGAKVVVVSATAGTTDDLLKLGEKALKNGLWEKDLKRLIERHKKIAGVLELNISFERFEKELNKLLRGISLVREISPAKYDHLASFGERISSLIFTVMLEKKGVASERINAKEIIFTDNRYTNARVNFKKTNKAIQKAIRFHLNKGNAVILTGFIASSIEGKYSTLGRGGSDYTAAIVAAALGAKELRIYTDVSGIYECDPKLIKEAKPIPKLSFNEASELAYFGAKVLHPKTILPAIKNKIPVRILNTFEPRAKGTVITSRSPKGLKAITVKNGAIVVNIESVYMFEAHGFLAKIFEIFKKHEIVVDVLATSEVSVSLTVNFKLPKKLIEEIFSFAKISESAGFSIICLVGDGLTNSPDFLRKLFGAIDGHKIKMISQGASRRNITFLVKEKESKKIVSDVFDKFFKI